MFIILLNFDALQIKPFAFRERPSTKHVPRKRPDSIRPLVAFCEFVPLVIIDKGGSVELSTSDHGAIPPSTNEDACHTI